MFQQDRRAGPRRDREHERVRCPDIGVRYDIFGSGGGEKIAPRAGPRGAGTHPARAGRPHRRRCRCADHLGAAPGHRYLPGGRGAAGRGTHGRRAGERARGAVADPPSPADAATGSRGSRQRVPRTHPGGRDGTNVPLPGDGPTRARCVESAHADRAASPTSTPTCPPCERCSRTSAAIGCEAVWCAGDVVGRGPHPNEVVDELRRLEIPTVQGNWDEAVGMDREQTGASGRRRTRRRWAAHRWPGRPRTSARRTQAGCASLPPTCA